MFLQALGQAIEQCVRQARCQIGNDAKGSIHGCLFEGGRIHEFEKSEVLDEKIAQVDNPKMEFEKFGVRRERHRLSAAHGR